MWPDWVLRELKNVGPTRVTLGKSPERILPSPERKFKCVCTDCNEGWMSDLETESRPLIGAMLNSVSIVLDSAAQRQAAIWATKCAMVSDAIVKQDRSLCFNQDQRERLRITGSMPSSTTIWMGRFCKRSLAYFGTDVWLTHKGVPKAGRGSISTFVVGHLVFQIATLTEAPKDAQGPIRVETKNGPWTDTLVSIWPIVDTVSVVWPPRISFTNDGGRFTIGRLMDRWKTGTRV